MAEYNNRVRTAGTAIPAIDEGLRSYMLQVYNYMLVGLSLTGAVAFATRWTAFGTLFFGPDAATGIAAPTLLGWIAIFAPLAMVFFLSFRVHKMSFAAAQMTFWIYASVMGISIALLLFTYTGASVARVFFITAGTFGAMSLYGYSTKRDLSGWGSFLFMGVIGLIIAMVVNIFLGSTMMDWIISVVGVLIFTGLTAYDTQRIKQEYDVSHSGEVMGKMAVMGALKLYLDFINLFIFLLRMLGDRR